MVRPRRIGENPAHQPGRQREEVNAILPFYVADSYQTDERLVHERCRLQRMARPFPAHVTTGDPTELPVHERRQSLEGSLVPISPRLKQLGDPLILDVCHDASRPDESPHCMSNGGPRGMSLFGAAFR
jgi:hypothetical protein